MAPWNAATTRSALDTIVASSAPDVVVVNDKELFDAMVVQNALGFVEGAAATKPGLPRELVRLLARRHGSGLDELLENVRTIDDLGQCFGGHLYEIEARYLIRDEWAVDPDDIVWSIGAVRGPRNLPLRIL